MDISKFKRVVVLTGAGISHESGIPTFRGEDGHYKNRSFMELASLDGFRRDPLTVWQWYDERRAGIKKAEPNAAHRWLVALENSLLSNRAEFQLITQNVDFLHQHAGSASVLELHGSIWKIKCTNCIFEKVDYSTPIPTLPPRCPKCGELLRPGVVWFGEQLDQDVLMAACEKAAKCDLFIVVGTSSIVWPAASLPLTAKEEAGAFVIEVNPEKTAISDKVDLHLQGKASTELVKLGFRSAPVF
jgi:NAD-dependent deacetylase